MPESPLIEKEIAALADLEALIAARAKGETETELFFHRRREKEEHEFQSASSQLSSRYKAEKAALEAEYEQARQAIVQTFERETQAVQAEYAQVKQKIEPRPRRTGAGPRRPRKRRAGRRWRCTRPGATGPSRRGSKTRDPGRHPGRLRGRPGRGRPGARALHRLAGPEPSAAAAAPAAEPPAGAVDPAVAARRVLGGHDASRGREARR